FIQHTVPAVAIAQIQSDGQFLLRNIPALRCRSDANLLHCRSPFYLCFEHVDNLGAYTASRPETGLLIPSVFASYQSQHHGCDTLAWPILWTFPPTATSRGTRREPRMSAGFNADM